MRSTRIILIAAVLCIAATAASASWYDDYDAGLAAAEKGQWNVVVQKMTSAINGNAKEGGKTRTYGAIFINYHPYYYRGVAYLNLGKYQQAIDDLDKATGVGPSDLGTIEALHDRAAAKLQAASAPVETPAPTPVAPRPTVPTPIPTATAPTVTTPAAPVIDPGIRQRADNAIGQARARIQAAQQRKATASPPYAQAVQALADANLRRAAAKTNDELNQVAALAENAALQADSATAPGAPPAPAVAAIIPKPVAATGDVMADSQRRVRHALEQYFAGEFESAASEFTALTKDMPRNGLIWAFLGASQYAQYAFERDPTYEASARASFRKAKELRPSLARNGLSERYFSRRVRTFFKGVS
jgi:tetratricopeptide (TPR) repeat protein